MFHKCATLPLEFGREGQERGEAGAGGGEGWVGREGEGEGRGVTYYAHL